MIIRQINRIKAAQLGQVVVAITENPTDNQLAHLLEENKIDLIRGSENDVASRFKKVLDIYDSETFIRLTADCPLLMPELLIAMVEDFHKTPCDYLSNTNPPSFPDGLDIEIIRKAAFENLLRSPLTASEREHVTLGIYKNSDIYTVRNFQSKNNLSNYRWTVDYEEDFDYIQEIYSYFIGKEATFSFNDVLELHLRGFLTNKGMSASYRNISLNDKFGEDD